MFADGFKGKYKTIPFAFYKLKPRASKGGLFTHHHREVEIIAIYQGGADFYTDSDLHKMKTGDVLVIPPYCVHRAVLPADTAYDCVCLDLSMLWDRDLQDGLETGRLTVIDHLSAEHPFTEELNGYVRQSIRACEGEAPGWEMEVSIFFGRLKREGLIVDAEAFSKENEFEKRVIDYINDHYHEQISSTSVANALYINNSYFCRLFKRSFGCCFSDFLLGHRVNRAKLLLNSTRMQVSEVALRTGFGSFSYFSKVFKRDVGQSPTEYRRRKQKELEHADKKV